MKKSAYFVLTLLLCMCLLLSGCSLPIDLPFVSDDDDSAPNDFSGFFEDIEGEQGSSKPPKGSGKSVEVAPPLDLETQFAARSDVMDFMPYLTGYLTFDDLNNDNYLVSREYSCDEDNYFAIEAYVELLCTEYSFEVVGTPYYEAYTDAAFFDIVLRYTGGDRDTDGRAIGLFSDTAGDLAIYGVVEYGDIEGYFSCDRALTMGDDGFRCGQDQPTQTRVGASLGAGLVRLSDGSYQTSDGRLTARMNGADLLTDGHSATYDARYEISIDPNRFNIYVEDAYKNALLHFYVPSWEDWSEGLYDLTPFIREESFAVNSRGVEDSLPSYTWDYMFCMLQDGSYVYPVRNMGGEMSALSMRVMYCDDTTLVFYTCAQFRSGATVECLSAVSTDVEPTTNEREPSGSGEGKTRCSACSGSGNCSTCGGSGQVRRLVPGTSEWIYQDCTSCRPAGSGNCSWCSGEGETW